MDKMELILTYWHRLQLCYKILCCILKLVFAIFYKFFVSHQMMALQKLWKTLFISPKKLFSFSVSHCFRGWWKINLKVCDVINCLNKNLITHFVWYLRKEKRYDIETLSIRRVLNKEHFYWKIMHKMCTRDYFQTSF